MAPKRPFAGTAKRYSGDASEPRSGFSSERVCCLTVAVAVDACETVGDAGIVKTVDRFHVLSYLPKARPNRVSVNDVALNEYL